MWKPILFAVVVLSIPAGAFRHRQILALKDPSTNQGAKIDPQSGTVPPGPPPLATTPSFVEAHSARVANDLVLFPPTLLGLTPPSRGSHEELFGTTPTRPRLRFFTPAPVNDSVEVSRERDRLLFLRVGEPQGNAVALGLAMFGVMTVLSAHAPHALRILFDGPVHLGPAIFDGGGMGAGIAGRGF